MSKKVSASVLRLSTGLLIVTTATYSMISPASNDAPVTVDADVPELIRAFYETRNFCSVASVVRVRTQQQDILVDLTIDPRWAKTLARKDDDLRQRWFSIHCPQYAPAIWNSLDEESDIVINGPLPDMGNYQLNCKAR